MQIDPSRHFHTHHASPMHNISQPSASYQINQSSPDGQKIWAAISAFSSAMRQYLIDIHASSFTDKQRDAALENLKGLGDNILDLVGNSSKTPSLTQDQRSYALSELNVFIAQSCTIQDVTTWDNNLQFTEKTLFGPSS